MAKLVYNDGGVDHDFALDPGRAAYTIGRNPMCDLRINNPSMSRKHAEVRLDAASGRYSVHDLNSSNGTFVNGRRISQCELSDGDEVLCGEFELRFVNGAERVPSPSPPATVGSRPVAPPAPPAPAPAPARPRDTIAGMPADLLANSSEVRRLSGDPSASSAPEELEIIDLQRPVSSTNSGALPGVPAALDAAAEAAVESGAQSYPASGPASSTERQDETERELRAARAELKSLRLALQNESNRAADATAQRTKAAREIERLESELSSLKKELEAARRASAEAQKAAREAVQRAEGAEKRLAEKASEAARYEGELEVLRARIEAAPDPAHVQQLEAKNAAMREAFKDLSSELQQLIQANRDLMAQVDGGA